MPLFNYSEGEADEREFKVTVYRTSDGDRAILRNADGSEIDDTTEDLVLQALRRRESPTYLYLGHSLIASDRWKIGVSRDPKRRQGELKMYVVHQILFPSFKEAADTERFLHDMYRDSGQHINGEWFRLTEKDVVRLKSLKTPQDTYLRL